MKPQPLSCVKITSEEEYDISVRAFVKAGGELDKANCHYLNIYDEEATSILLSEDWCLFSNNDDRLWSEGFKELTIAQLREYLDESEIITSKYKVDDLLILDGDYNQHYEVVGFDGDDILVTHGSDRVQRTTEDSVTEHYRKVKE